MALNLGSFASEVHQISPDFWAFLRYLWATYGWRRLQVWSWHPLVICPVEIFWAPASRPGMKVGMEWNGRWGEWRFRAFFFFFRKKGEDIYTTCTCFSRVLVEMVPSKQMPSKIVVPNPPRASQDVWKQVGWKTACPGDCLTDWRNHKWIPFPSIFSYIVRVSSLSTVYIYNIMIYHIYIYTFDSYDYRYMNDIIWL